MRNYVYEQVSKKTGQPVDKVRLRFSPFAVTALVCIVVTFLSVPDVETWNSLTEGKYLHFAGNEGLESYQTFQC